MELCPVVLAGFLILGSGMGSRAAHACSGGQSAPTAAFPGAGATGVSPQSSLFVVSGVNGPPALSLKANGAVVALPAVINLGQGLTADGWATFSRLAGPLQPSSDYVLEAAASDGSPTELTHFSTAATYDKTQGTGAALTNLRLWRVHYPSSLVAAGGCVFSEYEGYFALDYVPASVPATDPSEVVSVLTLSAAKLGTSQSFVFNGITALPGGYGPTLVTDGVMLPEGGALSAAAALWKPQLEPGMEYCASVTAYGRNDLAAGPAQSNAVCATVVGLEANASGAAVPIGDDVASKGGCAVLPVGRPGLPSLVIAGCLMGLLARTRRSRSRL